MLAVGIVSSQAQSTVYSQNVVGYANVVTPGNGSTYYSMTVPFVIGASNGANEVFGTNGLTDTTTILTWNGGGYTSTVFASPTDENISGVQWYTDQNEDTAAQIPVLPPGEGFFLQPGPGNLTNTFAGTIAAPLGGTTNMTLVGNGATYYSVGSIIPFAGYITNIGGVNMTNLPDTSTILTWNGSGYTSTVYAAPTDENISGIQFYTDQNEDTPAPCPTLIVGQGFFLQPGPGTYLWSETLPSN